MPVGVPHLAAPGAVPSIGAGPAVEVHPSIATSLGQGTLSGALISIAATPNAAAVGDLVLVQFAWASSSIALSTVTDTSGNTWTVVSTPANANEVGGYAYTTVTTGWASGANTVTGTLASGAPGGRVWSAASIAAVYSPVVDQHNETSGSTATVSITTASPLAQAAEVVFIHDLVRSGGVGFVPSYRWTGGFLGLNAINGSGTPASGVALAVYDNLTTSTTAVTGGFNDVNNTGSHGTSILAVQVTIPSGGPVTNLLTVALAQATSAAIQNAIGKPLTLTEPATLTIAKQVGKPVGLVQTTTVTLAKRTAKILTFTETAAVTLAKLTGKPIAMTQATAVSLVARLVHLLTITLTQASSVAIAKQVGKPLTVAQASAVVVTKRVGKVITPAQATTISLAKRVAKLMVVAQASALSVTARLVHLLTIALTQAASVTIVKRCGKTLSVAQTSTVTITKRARKIVAVAAASALAVLISVTHKASAVLSAFTGYVATGDKTTMTTGDTGQASPGDTGPPPGGGDSGNVRI